MRHRVLPPERFAAFDRLIFAVFVIALPAVVAAAPRIFNDGDVSWHVAAGRWIIDHGRIPSADPFSFTMAGKPWIAYEWAAEVVYAAAYDLAGYAGLSAVVAAALVALSAILFLHLRSSLGPIGLLLGLTAVYLVVGPFTIARPHLLAWPLLAGWTALVLAGRERGKAPPLAAALVMLVWANVHGSFALGFVIAAAAALDAAVASSWDRRALLNWATFGAGAAAAAMLNANGLKGLLHPLTVSGMESLPVIEEWMPSMPGTSPLFHAVLAGAVIAILIRRPRFTIGEKLLLILLLAMALLHIRHQAILGIVGAMIIGPRLAGRGRDIGRGEPDAATGWLWPAAGVAAVIAVLAIRLVAPLSPKENFANPRGLLASIPPDLRTQPVLNEYSFGGPLILAGIRPFVDGRADMYGDGFVADYVAIERGDARKFAAAVERYGIRWTMLHRGSGLAEKLDRSPDWARVHSDEVGVIHRMVHQPNRPLSDPRSAENDER